jgi:hypothetical protein
MNLDEALRDLAEALAAGDRTRARSLLVARCVAVLGLGARQPSVAEVIRLGAGAPPPARRACAVLVVHALAVPGVVPPASGADVCTLMESALRSVLLRGGYPFGGPLEERMRVLRRLHTNIRELMQPLEPTFPNWQGLYAG